MKAETQDKLEQIGVAGLERISQWVERAEAFADEQAPLVVQEIITWGFWSNTTLATGLLMLTALCGITAYLLINRSLKEHKEDDFFLFVIGIVVIIGGVVSLIFGLFYSYMTFYVAVAPRLYVIEQLRELMR